MSAEEELNRAAAMLEHARVDTRRALEGYERAVREQERCAHEHAKAMRAALAHINGEDFACSALPLLV